MNKSKCWDYSGRTGFIPLDWSFNIVFCVFHKSIYICQAGIKTIKPSCDADTSGSDLVSSPDPSKYLLRLGGCESLRRELLEPWWCLGGCSVNNRHPDVGRHPSTRSSQNTYSGSGIEQGKHRASCIQVTAASVGVWLGPAWCNAKRQRSFVKSQI